jgi:hypothetical protein
VNIVPSCSSASRLGYAETLRVQGLDALCARQLEKQIRSNSRTGPRVLPWSDLSVHSRRNPHNLRANGTAKASTATTHGSACSPLQASAYEPDSELESSFDLGRAVERLRRLARCPRFHPGNRRFARPLRATSSAVASPMDGVLFRELAEDLEDLNLYTLRYQNLNRLRSSRTEANVGAR